MSLEIRKHLNPVNPLGLTLCWVQVPLLLAFLGEVILIGIMGMLTLFPQFPSKTIDL